MAIKNGMKTIYLCGPITEGRNALERIKDWRMKATQQLNATFNILDPTRRLFDDDNGVGIKEIILFDEEDIDSSDILLVNFDSVSVGTSMEVYMSYKKKKHIVAFSNIPKKDQSPWMIHHCTRICDSLDDAIKYIKRHRKNIKRDKGWLK